MILFTAETTTEVETTTKSIVQAAQDTIADPEMAVSETIVSAIAIAIAIAFALLILFILQKAFKKYSPKIDNDVPKEKKTLMRVIYSISRFAVIVVLVIIILSIMGVNISGAIAALGIAGACGALAIQDLLKDLIQGVNIVTDKFFAIGDSILYNGTLYKVVELTMRNTKLLSLDDGSTYTVGNHLLTDIIKVPNDYMVDIPVCLPYTDDYDHIWETMEQIAEKVGALSEVSKSIFKGIKEFDDSSVNYLLRFYCRPEDSYEMKRHANRIIQRELKKAGISIPFPQLDVHLDKED